MTLLRRAAEVARRLGVVAVPGNSCPLLPSTSLFVHKFVCVTSCSVVLSSVFAAVPADDATDHGRCHLTTGRRIAIRATIAMIPAATQARRQASSLLLPRSSPPAPASCCILCVCLLLRIPRPWAMCYVEPAGIQQQLHTRRRTIVSAVAATAVAARTSLHAA